MNFCSKAHQMATVSPQKNQQKNPRHGGNMQNQLFPVNLKGVRQLKQYLKGNDDPSPRLSGKNSKKSKQILLKKSKKRRLTNKC